MYPNFINDFIDMLFVQVKSLHLHGIYECTDISYLTLVFCLSSSFLISLAIFSGLFYNITIVTGTSQYNKIVFAYKYVRGDAQVAHSLLMDYKELAPDLPRIVINYTRLHYKKELNKQDTFAIGLVISINDNPAWLGDIQILKENEFSFHELPGINHAILTKFPYRCYLSMCMANLRVLPQIKAFIKKHQLCAHPVLELIQNEQIQYVVPMSFQFDYYVPQAKKYYKMAHNQDAFSFHATPDRSISVLQQLRLTPSNTSVNTISMCSTN